MAKIIDYDFRKGSIINNGTLAVTEVLSNATIQKSEKGMSFVSTQAGSNTLQINTTLNGTYSVELAVRVDSVAGLSGYLFDARYSSGTGYLYTSTYAVLSASAGTVYRDGVARNTLPPLNTWMHIVVSGIPITCTRLMFNSNSIAAQGCIGKYAFFRVYEGTLTAQEVAKLYADYQNPAVEGKPKRGFLVNKPNDLSKEVKNTVTELVSSYDFTSGWTAGATGVINSSTNFSITSAGGYIVKTTPTIKAGSRYRLIYTVNGTSGAILRLRDTAVSNDYVNIILNGSTQSSSVEFTASVGSVGISWSLITVAPSNVTISDFKLQELSGLVAAYNMKPQGTTLVDISGNGYNGTLVGGPVVSQDGLLFDGVNDYVTMSNSNNNNLTALARVTILNNAVNKQIIGRGTGDWNVGTTGTNALAFRVETNTGGIKTFTTASNVYTVGTPITIAITYDGSNIRGYIDGVQVGTTTAQTGTILDSGNLMIGSYGGVSGFTNMIAYDYREYNRALSLQEIKDYHNSFAKQPVLVEDFSDAPADGTSIVPRQWQRVSGTWKIGELSLVSGTLVTNGGFDTDTSWSKDTGVTISGGTGNFNTSGDAGLYQSVTTLVVGKTYRATYTITSRTSGTLFFRLGVNEFSGTSRTSAGTYTETFTYKGTGTGTNRCEIRASGVTVASVDNFSIIEIDPLPTLTKGSKYLECVTAGILTIPSQQAYGTWEFDWYKGADANVYEVTFINKDTTVRASGVTGMYGFLPSSDEGIYLVKDFNTYITRTAASYFTNNTWYRTRITRTTAGVFTTLIKGGSFTPTAGYDGWTLLSTTGGSGSNPGTDTSYTTSNYLLLNLKAGDRFANLKLTQGVQA